MSKAKIVVDAQGRYCGIEIKCPAGHEHVVPTDWRPPGMERYPHQHVLPWKFNGDLERPTLTPSILERTGHYCHTPPVPGNCACDFQDRYPGEDPWEWPCMVCHSFVRDGRIQFLSDCTHALAGQTVDLPDME